MLPKECNNLVELTVSLFKRKCHSIGVELLHIKWNGSLAVNRSYNERPFRTRYVSHHGLLDRPRCSCSVKRITVKISYLHQECSLGNNSKVSATRQSSPISNSSSQNVTRKHSPVEHATSTVFLALIGLTQRTLLNTSSLGSPIAS